MFTYECLLAAALLSLPAADDAPRPDICRWAEPAGSSIVAMLIEAEVLDPRERAQYDPSGPAQLAFLRCRIEYHTPMPMIEECERFVSRSTINDYLAFNRALRADLVKQLQFDAFHAAELRCAIWEADVLYNVWDTLRDARCEYYYVTVRRQALQALLEMIGPEAFYAGRMPPHVPTWRIPSARPAMQHRR